MATPAPARTALAAAGLPVGDASTGPAARRPGTARLRTEVVGVIGDPSAAVYRWRSVATAKARRTAGSAIAGAETFGRSTSTTGT